jgi:signal transduction histidine kinase
MVEWLAAAVLVTAVGAGVADRWSVAWLTMVPIIGAALAWMLVRLRYEGLAGAVLVVGCALPPVVGVYTPWPEMSGFMELIWLTMTVLLGAFVLPLRLYLGASVLVLVVLAGGVWHNPSIEMADGGSVLVFLSVLVMFAWTTLRFVERRDQESAQRHAALQDALSSAEARARELASARLDLRETRSQLVHLSRLASLGELAAGVAHELNNPLTTVLMSGEVLYEELQVREPALAPLAADVLTAAKACQAVSSGVLRFGRRASTQRAPVSLSTLLRRARRLTHTPLCHANTRLVLHLEDDGLVIGDGVQLTQVLVNLILNAANVMRPNGGQVDIYAGLRGSKAWIRVSDDGPGVPRNLRERIFEPFYSTRTDDGGTGLGLSISRAVAESHGGTLVLLDVPHLCGDSFDEDSLVPIRQGAAFELCLPDAVPVDAPGERMASV